MHALPPIARPAWRDEWVTGAASLEAESMLIKGMAGIEAWPRELSKPIAKRFADALVGMPRPISGGLGLQPLRDVLAWADAIKRELSTLKLEMVSGDGELCELAERCAVQCSQYPEAAEFIVQRVGLDPPGGRHMTDSGRLLRMQCVRWWRRSLRRHFGQAVENAMRSRGLVRKGRAAYCTDWALRRRTSQKRRNRTMLESALATNELGQQFTLFELAEKSVSNPALRRAELMTRISGFEKLAEECGHIALFGTLTAPSCFHAQHHGAGENPLYTAAGRPSVRAAQQWLTKMWARARAKLHRLKVALYGFRIAEPHHDGTPHWHTLFFVPKGEAELLVQVVRGVWLSEHRDEKGAAKYRCQFKKINPAIGSASGYVAKYVAKNIDGFEVGPDYEAGGNADSTAHRVDAWASTHRIRQFQQIGGAKVGVWRECRRVTGEVAKHGLLSLSVAVLCADAGDWAGFCKAAPGISLWKEQTGECNQYREIKAPSVIGVECGSEQVRTRLHEWSVQWGGKCKSGSQGLVGADDAAHRLMPIAGATGVVPGIHSDSAPAGLPPLGPVSITVRSEEQRPRGDGLMLYQVNGSWRAHRAISISRANYRPPPLDPQYQFIQSVPFRGQSHASGQRSYQKA